MMLNGVQVVEPGAAVPALNLRLRQLRRFVPSLRVAMLAMALLAFGCGWAKGLLWGVPPPVAQDESGYLLNADTFASGRLTNPTHPMWRHFESMFVIQKPTYTSKYPPGQGLFLGLGQKLFGEPIYGVWLSTALASAALCWMFWQWLTPRWAFLASLIATTHLLINYWNFTYWGGSVAAIGSALVFGSVRRLPDRFGMREGLLVGLGIAIFANTRPFEGMVTCAFAVLFALVWVFRNRVPLNAGVLLRASIPALAVLAVAGAWLGYYNWRTTGSPTTFAQKIHSEDYYPVPVLIVQHPAPAPHFTHEYMKVQYERDMDEFAKQHTVSGFIAAEATKFLAIWNFYVGVGLILPLFVLPFILKNPWTSWAAAVAGAALAVMFFETWLFPHYAAPVAALIFVVLIQTLPLIWSCKWADLQIGKALVSLMVLFHVALIFAAVLHRPTYIETRQPWALARQHMASELKRDGHEHLLIVHYAPNHRPDEEWVYNKADLDNTPIVWAHELAGSEDQEILNYYSKRYVWLVDADAKPPRISALRSPLN